MILKESRQMEKIQSSKNERVKNWKRLLKRKGRKEAGQYLIEGFHLIEEAIKAGVSIAEILIREDLSIQLLPDFRNIKVTAISKEVTEEISDTETSQGIYAVVNKRVDELAEDINGPFLMADAVQDPGNLGTMIRSADAAGFQGIVLGRGTVDAYNSKTLRSAQGSHFHIDLFEGEVEEWISLFQKKGYTVYGTALDKKAESYREKHHQEPFALVVGNEGSGVSKEVLSLTNSNLYIPIKGKAESLNVAIAASILMFSLYN